MASVSAHRMVKDAIDAFLKKQRLLNLDKTPQTKVFVRLVDGVEISGVLDDHYRLTAQSGYLVVKMVNGSMVSEESVYINVDYVTVIVIEPFIP